MTPFSVIRARAEARKGGPEKLAALLPPAPGYEALKRLPDDRALAEMTKRVFSAGFAPGRIAFQPDDYWDALTRDARIVRNGAKILSVRKNALFVQAIAKEHGSFGVFLAAWPSTDEIGLLDLLAKRGDRLGGMSGQMFLRFIGWDGFTTSRDVVACLRDAGLDIAEEPKSKSDLKLIQAQFNAWSEETGLPYRRLSRICAFSIGENASAERSAHGEG